MSFDNNALAERLQSYSYYFDGEKRDVLRQASARLLAVPEELPKKATDEMLSMICGMIFGDWRSESVVTQELCRKEAADLYNAIVAFAESPQLPKEPA